MECRLGVELLLSRLDYFERVTGGAFQRANLPEDGTLKSLNGRPLRDMQHLAELLQRHAEGAEVEFGIDAENGRDRRRWKVKLGPVPAVARDHSASSR